MEIFRDQCEAWIHFKKGIGPVKAMVIFLYALCIYLIYRFFGYIGILIAAVVYLWLCEKALLSNVKFTEDSKTLDQARRTVKHGDLVFFRSYENYDLPELLFYRHLNALTSRRHFFGHIGIVIEINGKKHILESTEDPYFSKLVGYTKNGVHLMEFDERVKKYSGRVHVVPTRLGEFLRDRSKISAYIEKMKDVPFLSWSGGGINCLLIIRDFMNLFGVLKHPHAIPWRPEYFLDEKRYNVPVEFGEPYFIINDFIHMK